jgi:hypothetical protein
VGELWNSFSVPHYNSFFQRGTNKKGGVTVAVGKHLRTERIDTDIENTVIVDINGLSEPARVIAVYWSQCQKRDLDDLKPIIVERTILMGDFNATAEEWNSHATDARGKVLKQWIEKNNLLFIPGTLRSVQIDTLT